MSIPSALDLIPNQDRPPNTEIPSALDLLGEERETSVLADRLNLIWQFFRTEWSQEARDEFARSAASSPSGVRALLRAGGRLLQLPRTLAPGMRTYIADDKPSLLEVPVKDLLAAVPEGIVGLASEPIAAFTGVRSEGGRLVPATEEERSAAILETAGNVVGLAAGVAAGQAVTKRAVSQVSKQLDATKTAFEAQKVVDKFKGGALSRAIKRGAAEGAVGGAAFGIVANPDDPDALTQALIGGVLFAPLGIAFERLRYLGKSTDEIGRRVGVQASILQQVRMLQATTDDSFYGINRKLVGLETADDIAEAALIGRLQGDEPFIIPGVTDVARLTKLINEEQLTPTLFYRDDGAVDVLVGKYSDRYANTFRKTGYKPNEIISKDGIDYTVSSVSKDGKLIVREIGTDKRTKIDPTGARRNPRQEQLLYHGTRVVFDEFDPKRQADPEDLLYGPGVYLADYPNIASEYAETKRSMAEVDVEMDLSIAEKLVRRSKDEIIRLRQDIEMAEKALQMRAEGTLSETVQHLVDTDEQIRTLRATMEDLRARNLLPPGAALELEHDILTRESQIRVEMGEMITESDVARAREKLRRIEEELPELETKVVDAQKKHDEFKQSIAPNVKLVTISKANIIDVDNPLLAVDEQRIVAQMAKEGIPTPYPAGWFDQRYNELSKDVLTLIANFAEAGEVVSAEQAVLRTIQAEGPPPNAKIWNTGQEAYDYLVATFGELAQANAFLQRAGFKGIAHEGGRRVGGGKRPYQAYVIFDAKDARPGLPQFDPEYGVLPTNIEKAIVNDFNTFFTKDPSNVFVLDVEPTTTFREALREFAEARGYSKAELPVLEDIITRDWIKQLADSDPELAADLSSMKTLREEFTEQGLKDQQELIRRAQTNNFFIEGEGAGRFTIRDNAGNRIGTFSTIEEALEFTDKSGQAAGPDANGGSILPPRFTVGLTPDEPPRPNEAPYIINRNNFGEAFNDMVNIKLDWVTQPLTMMKAIDKKFGTRFYELVGDPGMTAARRFSAAVREPMEKLEKILKPVVRLTRDRREVIGGYIEALNAVKNALPEEQAIAQQVLSKQIDFTNLMKYRKGVQKILKATQDQATIDAMARALRQQLNLSDEALKVSGLIDGTPKVRLGVVGQLVRNNGVQLKKYVSDHKMTLKEIAAAEQLNQFNKELGPESEILNAVMRHASLYLDGDIGAAARHFGLRPEQEAFLKRAFKETGELEAYEVDPFMSAVRFIRARASDTHLQKFVKEARAFIRNEVKKTGDLDESARGMLTNFLGDLQGHPTQSRKAMRALIADVNKRRGWNLDEDVIHKTVSLILQTGEAALQGARVLYAGVRDFMQPVILYDARFGARATSKMLDYGVNGYDKITAQMLEDSGEIARYDLITVAQADEYTRSVMGRGAIGAARTLQAANKAAFRLSGQSAAYRRIAAGIYLERWDTASEALLKYARGELTKDQAFKQLKMQTYDPPVIEAFERLVSAQKYEDATRFLARATVAENIGVFSQGNRIAWQRREFGRLAGQFGNWSQWFRAHLGQQLTRGTVGDRLAYITRLGASQAAFVAAGAALGINMRAWYLPPAVAFAGGPSVEMAQTLYDAMAGRGVEHELAVGKMKSLLPWQDGEPQIPNLWFPGKLFLTDVAEALELAESGDPRAPLRLAGYRPKD